MLQMIFGNFIAAVVQIVDMVLTLYMWIVIARAILSWVNPDPYNPIVRFLYNVTEPVFHAIRRRIPVSFGGIDFAPMIVIFAIVFLKTFLISSLRMVTYSM